jgi:YHS domain-containing protein
MQTTKKSIYMTKMIREKAEETRIFRFRFAVVVMIMTAMLITVTVGAQSSNEQNFNNLDDRGVILDGYDPVAFFTDNKPVKGTAQFQTTYQGAIYFFSSQDHLALFKNNPDKYRPQFGGWCAYAVSLGRTAPIDVNTFFHC